MSRTLSGSETLNPSLLSRLPKAVRTPGYDRKALAVGMAHVGVGAFHRCHQAEYTDDLLDERFDRWGVVGINIRGRCSPGRSGGRTASIPGCSVTTNAWTPA